MYGGGMDAGQMHRLGKRLIELARTAVTDDGDPPMTAGEVAVIEDAIRYPDSSVTDIHARTGYVQSHVSASVARLKQRRLVVTLADPADARRTLVRVTDAAFAAVMRRAGRPVDDVIAAEVATAAQARRATALLEELAKLLT
jgi:DNA-binding MarR family transcriptional regulator